VFILAQSRDAVTWSAHGALTVAATVIPASSRGANQRNRFAGPQTREAARKTSPRPRGFCPPATRHWSRKNLESKKAEGEPRKQDLIARIAVALSLRTYTSTPTVPRGSRCRQRFSPRSDWVGRHLLCPRWSSSARPG